MAGIKIIDVKVVGLCSKCRKEGDEIMRDNNGKEYKDRDISCVGCALGDCEEFDLSELWETFREINKDLDVLAIENIEDGINELIKKIQEVVLRKGRRAKTDIDKLAGNKFVLRSESV